MPPVASIDGVVGSANDLHVLLRHRLLLKPGGFESLILRAKGAIPDDQTVTEFVDEADRDIDRSVADLTPAPHRDYGDHDVLARVDELQRLPGQLRPSFRPLLVPETYPLPSLAGGTVGRFGDGFDDTVLGVVPSRAIEASLYKRPPGVAHDLHVLLRHRPRSIARAVTPWVVVDEVRCWLRAHVRVPVEPSACLTAENPAAAPLSPTPQARRLRGLCLPRGPGRSRCALSDRPRQMSKRTR